MVGEDKNIADPLISLKNIVYSFIIFKLLESAIINTGKIYENPILGVSYSVVFLLIVTSMIHWSISVKKLPYKANILGYVRYTVDFIAAFMYIGLINILPESGNTLGATNLVFWIGMVFFAYFLWDVVRVLEYYKEYRNVKLAKNLVIRSIPNAMFAIIILLIYWALMEKIFSEGYTSVFLVSVLALILIYRYIKNMIERPKPPS